MLRFTVTHLDGYHKLKTFYFAVHGCIDGMFHFIYKWFSRKILWLMLGPPLCGKLLNTSNSCIMAFQGV